MPQANLSSDVKALQRRLDWLGTEAIDHAVDIASVALISIATVLSAWCGYQSARWSGTQNLHYNQATVARIQSSEALSKADSQTLLDVALFVQFANAYSSRNTELETFLKNRMRPEALPAFEAWIAMKPLKNPKAPPSPFSLPQYHLAASAEAHRLNAEAQSDFTKAQASNQQSDDYVLFTVFFASLSFIGGIATKLRRPMPALLLSFGFVLLVAVCLSLARSPVI
jgi:hypothetical protein